MSGITKLMTAGGGGVSLTPASSIASDVTVQVPSVNDTLVGLAATQTLTNKTLTSPNINSAQVATVSGTAPLYMCRAWVNFDGTGTVAIRASGNVSSITDNGTGDYTVNFTTAMPDANYSACISASDISWGNKVSFVDTSSYLTSAIRIKSFSGSADTSSQADAAIYCVSVFR